MENTRKYHNVAFMVQTNSDEHELSCYHSIRVEFKDNELLCKDGGGNFSLYFQDSYLYFNVDSESKRIAGLSGSCPLKCLAHEINMPSGSIIPGILYIDNNEEFLKGTGWRMNFDFQCCYDSKKRILLLGKLINDKPIYKCLGNMYVQINEAKELYCIFVTDLLI